MNTEVSAPNYSLELVFINTGCQWSQKQSLETSKFKEQNPNILVRTEYPDESYTTRSVTQCGYRLRDCCMSILMLRDSNNGEIINSTYFPKGQSCAHITKWFSDLVSDSNLS